MGVDSRVWFPPWVGGDIACETVAVLAGALPVVRQEFSAMDGSGPDPRGGWSAEPVGLAYENPGAGRDGGPSLRFPDHTVVMFDDPEGSRRHFLYWHVDCSEGYEDPALGGGFMRPRATTLWVAACERAVRALGGRMDYSDSDSNLFDFEVGPDEAILPRSAFADGNEGFRARRDFLFNLPPLSLEDLSRANVHSSYANDPDRISEVFAPWLAFHEERVMRERVAKAPKRGGPGSV